MGEVCQKCPLLASPRSSPNAPTAGTAGFAPMREVEIGSKIVSVANETPAMLCALPGIRFIEVTGADAQTFLNAQLSRDVDGSDGALAAWHDSRGRVLALLRALRDGEQWLLMAHGGDPAALIRKLAVYVLRADVQFKDASADWRGAAILGDADHWLESHGTTLGPDPGDTLHTDGLFVIRVNPSLSYLAARKAKYAKIESELSTAEATQGELAEIALGRINLSADLSARFSPQMLNLDRLGALAVDKGCYPGQEVIARIQNLGNVKRRLFRFSGPLNEIPPLGSTLTDVNGTDVGEIVRAAPTDNQRVELLAVVRIDATDDTLVVGAEPETPLTRESLPGE